MNTRMFSLFVISVISLMTFSCASSYNTITPQNENYVSKTDEKGIQMEYKFPEIKKKYNKKASRKNIKILAVKLTNNTDTPKVFDKDIILVNNIGNQIELLDQETTYKEVKQSTLTYLLFLLLTPMQLQTTSSTNTSGNTNVNNTPIGLVIGPGITAANMIISGTANKSFRSDLENNELRGKTIQPGETVYGLLSIRSNSYNAISLKVE